ncbi:response regulator transcription factor [Pollutimonas sp. M17]|uniref:response regulator transcription factor n=1 Tax=Pollutimonas sp. M17 TaxID=2962065 RepID=UPI0021F4ECD4|nr:response regulator transcription factor [Pollutimonas sp. M17]UYO93708.1 response regulator transcription factor [Pollutimonas sp. M17]
MNIASVEDDLDQGRLIQTILGNAGHDCALFATGTDLLAALSRQHAFDLLLIDWELPDISGLDIVRWVRGNLGQTMPVMLITNRTLEEELIEGLQAGADDYMCKPIRAGELVARAEALLRRYMPVQQQSSFQCGAYEIDPAAEAIMLQGRKIELAPKEFELALLLFRNPGRLFSRDVLSTAVWNREIPATSRTLDTHLSNLRRKLQLRPEHGLRLNSSYALGYRLELLGDNLDPPTP